MQVENITWKKSVLHNKSLPGSNNYNRDTGKAIKLTKTQEVIGSANKKEILTDMSYSNQTYTG